MSNPSCLGISKRISTPPFFQLRSKGVYLEHVRPTTFSSSRRLKHFVKISEMPSLGLHAYELENGDGDRKPVSGNIMVLKFGGIETNLPSETLKANEGVCLPSSLEEHRLMTLSTTYDGLYEDHQGKQQHFPIQVTRIIKGMTVGQKVLILDMGEEHQRIYIIRLLDVQESSSDPLSPSLPSFPPFNSKLGAFTRSTNVVYNLSGYMGRKFVQSSLDPYQLVDLI